MISSTKSPSKFELRVELPPSTITLPPEAEYELSGVTLDGTFDIAVRYIGDERPPEEIIPATIYEELVEKLRTRVDLTKVEQATSAEHWPQIGTCRLQRVSDSEIAISVSLDEEWIS